MIRRIRKAWQPGDRIGAIRDSDEYTVNLFGYGVYEGEEVPPWGFAQLAGVKNPKLKLDSGVVVWGQDCWWGPEEKIKQMIGDRKVNLVAPFAPEQDT